MGAGIDDPLIAQHVELLGGAGHGLLAVADDGFEQVSEHFVLTSGLASTGEPRRLHMCEPPGDRVRHLAEHGQHRALRRLADRVVGRVGGARHRAGDQHRVDQLAGAAGELLGGAADDLREDDAGVAAGAHQGGAGERVDELGAADVVDHLAVEAVELLAHGVQRQRHVVAGVAVGDREDIEIVDLSWRRASRWRLAAVTTRRKRSIEGSAIERPPVPLTIGRRAKPAAGRDVARPYGEAVPNYAAFVTLPAFRQRVQT